MWLRSFLAIALAMTPLSVTAEPQLMPYYTGLGEDGQFYVTPQINHHAVRMLVDTGASDIIIGKDAAAPLELPVVGQTVNYTMADGRISVCRRVVAETFRLGTISRDKVLVSVCDRGSLALLGASVIRTFHVTITHDGILFEDK